jgi:DNA-binding NarL/FixJ family response regulator
MMEKMEHLAHRLQIHRQLEEKLWAEIHKAILDAYSEGCTVSFIARTLGITRQTVYAHLYEV